jgi:hypothetical protein
VIVKATPTLLIVLACLGVLVLIKNEVAHFMSDLKKWWKKREEEE